MSGLRLAAFASVVLAAAGLAVPAVSRAKDALAPCRLCSDKPDQSSNAAPAAPLRLQVESRLDFDKVVIDGNGKAVLALSPDGIARVSGAAIVAGARAMPGTVLVRGEPGRAVQVDLPKPGRAVRRRLRGAPPRFAGHRPAVLPANRRRRDVVVPIWRRSSHDRRQRRRLPRDDRHHRRISLSRERLLQSRSKGERLLYPDAEQSRKRSRLMRMARVAGASVSRRVFKTCGDPR